jgi:hypothetical protein
MGVASQSIISWQQTRQRGRHQLSAQGDLTQSGEITA